MAALDVITTDIDVDADCDNECGRGRGVSLLIFGATGLCDFGVMEFEGADYFISIIRIIINFCI